MSDAGEVEGKRAEDMCPDCRAAVTGGRAGCQALFEEVIARDFSDALYFVMHRTAVDAYPLQHPEPYCHSAKSLAAHLTGLCWALEFGRKPEIERAVRRWLDGPRAIRKLAPPAVAGGSDHRVARRGRRSG